MNVHTLPPSLPSQLIEMLANQPLGLALPAAESLEELAGFPLSHPILDLGCGDGFQSARLVAGRCRLEAGLDSDPTAVRLARRRGIHQQVICGTPENLPWPADHFQMVLILDALNRFKHPELVFRDVTRVLRPDGLLILSLPNCLATTWQRRLAGRLLGFSGGSGRTLTGIDSILHDLTAAGLKVTRRIDYGNTSRILPWLFSLPTLARSGIYKRALGRWFPFPSLHRRFIIPLLLAVLNRFNHPGQPSSSILIIRRQA